MSKSWFNGQQQDVVPVGDRGFQYGDGIFTTIRIRQGQCQLLADHLQRLRDGASYFKLPFDDWPLLAEEIQSIASQACAAEAVLKVVLSRGPGGRGYSSEGCVETHRTLTLTEAPGHYASWRHDGIDLGISGLGMGLNPSLAGMKHLNRLEQVLARQEIDEQDWQDAVMLDIDGYVVECNVANVFWRYDQVIHTPSLSLAGVDGIIRQQILSWCEQRQYQVEIERFPLDHLMMADEVWICNSLMGVVPVNSVDGQRFVSQEFSNRLQQHWESLG